MKRSSRRARGERRAGIRVGQENAGVRTWPTEAAMLETEGYSGSFSDPLVFFVVKEVGMQTRPLRTPRALRDTLMPVDALASQNRFFQRIPGCGIPSPVLLMAFDDRVPQEKYK